MSDHLGTSGVFINSIVGDGTRFVGDLELNGLLRIDGDFIGNIRTDGKVLIGKNGRAECTITADTVVIGGVVKGDIVSKGKVVILSTGMLIGNVSTPRLISEDGVILNGLCMISSVEEVSVATGSNTSSIFIEGEGLEKYNPAKISK
ncbi:MAG: polymer-forming cytoskeletal family protein [Bacteroidetes bacterium]|nr:MAG: polymer-forming cytoskeletal family protein [Bacteroidota bacterium]